MKRGGSGKLHRSITGGVVTGRNVEMDLRISKTTFFSFQRQVQTQGKSHSIDNNTDKEKVGSFNYYSAD